MMPPEFDRMGPPLMIVGAAGRLGRLLSPALAAMGLQSVSAQRNPVPDGTGLTWDPLAGPEPLLSWVARRGTPQTMVVLAGCTPSTGSDMSLNVSVARACLAAARAAGVGRILLASSSAVYGAGRETAWREADAADPTSDYGRAKLDMEHACVGQNVCALRIGNVAGADALLTNPARPVVIDQFADGHGPWRSYIGPGTLARVLARLADPALALPPVLNVGAPVAVDMAGLARAAGLPFVWRDAPPTAIGRLTLDTELLESLMEFEDTESTPHTLVNQWRAVKTPSTNSADAGAMHEPCQTRL